MRGGGGGGHGGGGGGGGVQVGGRSSPRLQIPPAAFSRTLYKSCKKNPF